MRQSRTLPHARVLWPVAAVAAAGLAACAPRRPPELPAPARFTLHVREILAVDHSAPEYFEVFAELAALGPEVDAVLVSLARDPAANTIARANALILLAERRSPAAIPSLRRALLTEEIPTLRTAAILGLQRLADTSSVALGLIRSAVGDPSRSVRLNALQALDIRQVDAIRGMIEHEEDRDVRYVATQLVALAESRGAPLAPDRRGSLRTTGDEDDPQIVFRTARVDSFADYATGDLRVELPSAPDVPLTQSAEVVGEVVPAFFSADRSRVVYEAERRIRVVDLATRETLEFGPGIAPRVVPFTNEFVFVREKEGGRSEADDGVRIRYWVYEGSFSGGDPRLVGELTATARAERHANYSPVRWMVVAETIDGFVLRGEGITSFPLVVPFWRGAPEEAAPNRPLRGHVDLWH